MNVVSAERKDEASDILRCSASWFGAELTAGITPHNMATPTLGIWSGRFLEE